MLKNLRRTLGGLALTLGLVAAPALSATAITGGTADGDSHPNVGLILFYDSTGGRFRCSATLVSPTVVLTAAHCTDGTVGTVGKTLVTFRSVIAEQAPSGFPVAADPTTGFTPAEIATYPGGLSGTAYTHPAVLGLH